MTEAELRDHIARNVALIEPGLTLLNKEKYIPHSLGTRGFVDLYAKDERGHHVLIELKRSGEASREALHEVHKYVEGVKDHLGAKDDEIRVIVASTEWRELLVPFSRFAAESNLSVIGLELHVVTSPFSVTASPVRLIALNHGRFIAPWHEVNWYLDENALERGINSIENSCRAKNIENYIIVVLRADEPVHSEHQAKMWSVIGKTSGINIKNAALPQLPTYHFIAYFAMQLTDKECLRILERVPDQLEEASEASAEMDSEEVLQYLHELVGALEPRPLNDHMEIGYPAKISRFLDEMGFEVESIRRFGAFQRNKLLDDSLILAELRGEDGSTGQRFKRSISVSNRAHMATARAELGKCLEQNPVWKGHILRALDEIESEFPDGEIDVSIFNPATGMLTLYLVAAHQNGFLYLPSYSLVIQTSDFVRVYYGGLEKYGRPIGFRQLIDKYYEGSISPLLFSMTLGGRDSRDLDITEDMGLAYRSWRCDIKGEEREFYSLRDDRWRSCESTNHLDLYLDYVKANEKFVKLVIKRISERCHSGLVDGSSVDKILEDRADLVRGKQHKTYITDIDEECSICKCALIDQDYIADCAVVGGGGAWGYLCADCVVFSGAKIGWGSGQLYLREGDSWLLVGGFPP